MKPSNSKQFREDFRILERRLGLLKKNIGSCCLDDITLAQCHALVEIGRAQTIILKDLSSILKIDISTTSRTVDSLVKKGYVERITSLVDRRSITISLTEYGNELFHNIESNNDKFFNTVFSNIPEDEKLNVLHALSLIINAFNNES